jgi:hypothetical protein
MQLNFARSSDIPDRPSARYRTAPSCEHPVIARIERVAGRITEGIVATAPLFWLALLLAFVAVSLGIIPSE